MKIVSCAYSPEFYKVETFPPTMLNHLFNIKQKYKFTENNHWFIHRTYVIPIIQLAFIQGVKVYCPSLDQPLLDALDKLMPKWRSAYSKVSKEVKGQSEKKKWFSIMYLTPDAPEFIVKAVWRALAAKIHPDAGGDAEVFMELKNAYEEVLKHVK